MILDQGHRHRAQHAVNAERYGVLRQGAGAPRVGIAGAGDDGYAPVHDSQHLADIDVPLVGRELGDFARHRGNDEAAHAVGDAFLEQAFQGCHVQLVVLGEGRVDDRHDAREGIEILHAACPEINP